MSTQPDFAQLTVADLLTALDEHIRDNQRLADVRAERCDWQDAHRQLDVAQTYRRLRAMVVAVATMRLRIQAAERTQRPRDEAEAGT